MKTTLAVVALFVWASVDVCAVVAQREAAVRPVQRPLVVDTRRDLNFGTVIPGIPKIISVSDVHGAGLFEINGAKHEAVRIELLLPPALTSYDGDELPVSFGPGDATAATDMGRFHGVAFDPRQPLLTTLGTSGKLFIRLGGTAMPRHGQPAGTYRAMIFLSVYDVGT